MNWSVHADISDSSKEHCTPLSLLHGNIDWKETLDPANQAGKPGLYAGRSGQADSGVYGGWADEWPPDRSKVIAAVAAAPGSRRVVLSLCQAPPETTHSFKVIPVPFRDSCPFGGGLHCVTDDGKDYILKQVPGTQIRTR